MTQASITRAPRIGRHALDDDENLVGADCRILVINASTMPVYKVRLKMIVGDAVWGPHPIGSMSPGQEVEAYARLLTEGSLINTDAVVRFVDARGQAWVANARGQTVPDPNDVQVWIDEGQAYIRLSEGFDAYERGMSYGVNGPNFDEWRQEMDTNQRM